MIKYSNTHIILQIQNENNLLFLFGAIFFIGLIGIVFKRDHFLITLLSIETMYLGIISSFVLISFNTFEILGQTCALLFLIVAACESAIGLGVLIVLYRNGKTLDFEDYETLKG